MVRGVVSLPSGTGKDLKIAVFAKDDKKPAVAPGGNVAIIKKDGGIEPPNHVTLKGSMFCWIANFGFNEVWHRAEMVNGKYSFRRRGNPKDRIFYPNQLM